MIDKLRLQTVLYNLIMPVFIIISGLMAIGWVLNIIELYNIETLTYNGKEVLRIIGIFVPPIGGIMGWI